MENNQVRLAIGGMIHDIGKILYRYNDGRNHSISGYDFLKDNGVDDYEILNQVKFHHSSLLRDADIALNSLAYITYWADNVSAGADRRDIDDTNYKNRFDKYVPLSSVFNLLNNNNQQYKYDIERIYDNGEINYPSEKSGIYSEDVYGRILSKVKEGLNQIELSECYVNSLLGVLEANLSFVPSSTDTTQYVDISLFDHMKVTAAIGSCMYEYLKAVGIDDYKRALFDQANEYYNKKAFLMFSMDTSGVQDFIYSVQSEGALKSLRSKSFYLEIMLEHIIDQFLGEIGVSRANLIYSGGGHAYILIPNTETTKNTIHQFENELTQWFIDTFRTDLYVACGYAECSANDLMNKTEGSYKDIFIQINCELSKKKASRYSANQIRVLNSCNSLDHERECKVCGRTDHLTDDGTCVCCSAFVKMSNKVLDEDFIIVFSSESTVSDAVVLPFGHKMIMGSEKNVLEYIKYDNTYVRAYSKNKMFTGFNVATKLWVGDYNNGRSFEVLASQSEGISKIGVLRADVDNLGQAFVNGFERKDGKHIVSISRTATFSRKMNMFFKLHINHILGNSQFSLDGNKKPYSGRHASVVYSGGDDLFIVGAWNEIIEAAVDINKAFNKYSQETLSISAGIGIFPVKYPVKALARQTGKLEEISKSIDGKNGITLFTEDGSHTYKWDTFIGIVMGEKYKAIDLYFSSMPEKGMSAMYKLMEYIRCLDDRINLARLAYMLGRMEPDKLAKDDTKAMYKEFSKKLYNWVSGSDKEENCKQLITAIYLYVYLHRSKKEGNDGKTK